MDKIEKIKEAAKRRKRVWYKKNREHAIAYSKKYQKAHLVQHKINSQNYCKKHPEKRKQSYSKCQKARQAQRTTKQRDYRRKDKLKYSAHKITDVALMKGLLIRIKCQVCSKLYRKCVKSEAHHCDYRSPLEVTWLCSKHHRAWHRVFKTEDKNE